MTDSNQKMVFLESGIFGMITYVAVDGLASILKMPDASANAVKKTGGFAMFLYLEVLDASFSFDGVIGAFALTHNLYLIAIGLGIGALWVRSMTIYLVEKGTLAKYVFLEHGAFYAIGALALMMLMDVFVHIPEAVTGLIGAIMIGWSLTASIQHDRPKRRRR